MKEMKSHLCMPRFKGGSRKSSRRLSPMTLLDRFREAVFRLIMLSALSKANTHNGETRRSPNNNSSSSSNNCQYRCYNPNDPHHSEAVADCIEFIKKSSTTDENRDSTASSSNSSDGASQVEFPVPVM
ncbi:hypothetical protein LguiA_005726 [Lonicera macranthoides]